MYMSDTYADTFTDARTCIYSCTYMGFIDTRTYAYVT